MYGGSVVADEAEGRVAGGDAGAAGGNRQVVGASSRVAWAGPVFKVGPGEAAASALVEYLLGAHSLGAHSDVARASLLLRRRGAAAERARQPALHCARQGYGIRRNSAHRTFIDTPMTPAMHERAPEPGAIEAKIERQLPVRRLGEPDDIAWGIVYPASEESKFVTGAEFVVDGGIATM